MSYAWEKFYSATRILALNNGAIKDRLINAFVHELHLLDSHIDQLSLDRQLEFSDILEQVTSVQGSEGSIAASINEMSEEKAIKISEWIFDTFLQLHDQRRNA